MSRLLLVAGLVVLAAVAGAASAGTTPGVAGRPPVVDDPSRPDDSFQSGNGTRIVQAGEEFTLQSGAGQAVRGRTDLPPGTELTVRVRSTVADQPYLRSATTTVDASGAFRATFDLSEVSVGITLAVVVHRSGSNLTKARADVVPCSRTCPAAMPATPGAVVADGGRVTLTNDAGQAVRGRTNLPPGSTVSVSVRSSSGRRPFAQRVSAVVAADGTFRAVFGLDDVATSVELRIGVVHNGTALTTARGVVQCTSNCPTAESGPEEDGYGDASVGVVQAANGSVARVPVRLGGVDAVALSVGGPGASYTLDVLVEDRTGDGTVVVLVNTTAASRSGKTVSIADAGDYVRVRAERGHLTATEYRLLLHPPEDESKTVATGLLVVTQGGGTGTSMFTPSQGPAFPLGSTAALVGGAVLAVAGLAFLLGLVEP